MANNKFALSAASDILRKKIASAKWFSRVIITGIIGYGLYCISVIFADLAHNLLANHTLGAIVLAVLAVNVFVSYPTLARGFKNLQAWGSNLFKDTDTKENINIASPVMAATATVSNATSVREQSLADVADEFAASVAEVSDSELEEELLLDEQFRYENAVYQESVYGEDYAG